jgi:hypothetical protein
MVRESWLTIMQRSAGCVAGLMRASGGSSAVEFALAAPVLLGLLVPVVDLGMAFSQQIKVQQSAQAGAQYATTHPWTSTSATAIANAVTAASTLTSLTASPAPSQSCGCPTRHRDRFRCLRHHLLEWTARRVLRHDQRAGALYPAAAVFGVGQLGDPHRAIDRPRPLA